MELRVLPLNLFKLVDNLLTRGQQRRCLCSPGWRIRRQTGRCSGWWKRSLHHKRAMVNHYCSNFLTYMKVMTIDYQVEDNDRLFKRYWFTSWKLMVNLPENNDLPSGRWWVTYGYWECNGWPTVRRYSLTYWSLYWPTGRELFDLPECKDLLSRRRWFT